MEKSLGALKQGALPAGLDDTNYDQEMFEELQASAAKHLDQTQNQTAFAEDCLDQDEFEDLYQSRIQAPAAPASPFVRHALLP